MKKLLPHGEDGHCNIFERDHDSVITGHGKHDRVCAFLPTYESDLNCICVYARIDHKWSLGMPTDKQVMDVCRRDQFIRGRWKKIKEEYWPQNNSTEQWYIKV